MANMNVRTPRFYPDLINYQLSRGIAQSEYAVTATDAGAYLMGTFTTGSAAELFDMKPLNKCTFDTSADPDGHVLITLDTQSAHKKSFVAILNHNMNSADSQVRIAASDTEAHIQAVDMGSATAIQPTEVVNGDTINGSSPYDIAPATDGSTIVKFAESSLRYWGIQFEGDGSDEFSGTDLFIGCILLGEYYEMPHAPDLSVKRSIIFDNTKLQESVGGQRYSNMTSHGRTASTTSKSPFNTNSYAFKSYGGRLAYDLNFSYLNSTDVMPNEYHAHQVTDDAVVEDIWNKTNGSHLPFIFSIDKDSPVADAESEHIFARFAQPSLDMTQVANDVFNVSMRIEEEF